MDSYMIGMADSKCPYKMWVEVDGKKLDIHTVNCYQHIVGVPGRAFIVKFRNDGDIDGNLVIFSKYIQKLYV